MLILGSVLLDIGNGKEDICRNLIPVVLNTYLSTDVLLGCDLLNKSAFLFDPKRKFMHWGKAPYQIHFIRKQKRRLEKVTHLPLPVNGPVPVRNLHTTTKVILPPPGKRASFLLPFVNPTVIVHPQGKVAKSCYPFCTLITKEQTGLCPFVNDSKAPHIFKAGTLFGIYEKKEVSSPYVHVTTEIQNDLLPHSDQSDAPGGRMAKLQDLLSQQKMSHLTPRQRSLLNDIILKFDHLFLLEKGGLGTLKVPPVQINVTRQRTHLPIPRKG